MQRKRFTETALTVSQEENFIDGLYGALVSAGYKAWFAKTQLEGLQVLHTLNPTVVIVDRADSGFAQLYQELGEDIPLLTASTHPRPCTEDHCITDLENGATRAICNASPTLLVALVGAVLRRYSRQPVRNYVELDNVRIDFSHHQVCVGKTPVAVTPIEFKILRTLAAFPGQVLSRESLFEQVWGRGFSICSHALDVHIFTLRRKLRSCGASDNFITTVKRLGIKLCSATAIAPDGQPCQVPVASGRVLSHSRPIWRRRRILEDLGRPA